MIGEPRASLDWRRMGRLVKPGSIATAVFLAVAVGPPWFRALVTQTTQNHAMIRVLVEARMFYIAVLLILPLSIAGLAVAFALAVCGGKRGPWLARGLALCIALVLGLTVAEGVSAARLAAMRVPMPSLKNTFPDPPGESSVDVVVLGESSARGVPYHDWLSVGDILAWKLQEAFPLRRFPVTQLAKPGLKLDEVHLLLQELKRRPDLVILYAGHNEFQMRYDWGHGAYHYADLTPSTPVTVADYVGVRSRVCRLIGETVGLLLRAKPPTRTVARQVVDVPAYTAAEYAEILHGFRVHLETITDYCERLGAVVVLVIPPGNDADFEPNRSFLPPETPRAEREAFASAFASARRLESVQPDAAIAAYRELLARQPGFAEAHYRLARRLEADGFVVEANNHYIAARDLDGLPMRCPSDFQDAYRDVAARHPRAILIDGPAVLRELGPRREVGDSAFTDGFHPSLIGYTALAQAILQGLYSRQTFAWSKAAPPPVVGPSECAAHFGMDPDKWRQVCDYASWFYYHTSAIRFDSSKRLAKSTRYHEASQRIQTGVAPERVGVPGVGTGAVAQTRARPPVEQRIQPRLATRLQADAK